MPMGNPKDGAVVKEGEQGSAAPIDVEDELSASGRTFGLKCSFCAFRYPTSAELARHQLSCKHMKLRLRIEQSKGQNNNLTASSLWPKCTECQVHFLNRYGLAAHKCRIMKWQHLPKHYKCKLCSKAYRRKGCLTRHFLRDHNGSHSAKAPRQHQSDGRLSASAHISCDTFSNVSSETLASIDSSLFSSDDHSSASAAIQNHLDCFLFERSLSDAVKLVVREVSTVRKTVGLSDFVRQLLDLPSSCGEYTSRTFFIFEEIEGKPVIVYACFVQEFYGRAVVTNFSIPSFAFDVNRQLHVELSRVFLLGYLVYARCAGFKDVMISLKNVSTPDTINEIAYPDDIFCGSDLVQPPIVWFLAILNEAKRLNCVDRFESMGDFLSRQLHPSQQEAALSCLFDDDCNTWSTAVENATVFVLKSNVTAHSVPSNLCDIVMMEAMSPQPFVVVHLKSNLMSDVMPAPIINDGQKTVVVEKMLFLSSPKLFVEKCREMKLDFSNFRTAAFSTSLILQEMSCNNKTPTTKVLP